jgi:hypothetical protein
MRTDDMARIPWGNAATREGKVEEEEKSAEVDGRRKGEGEKREGGGEEEEEGRAEKTLRRAVEQGMADMVRERRGSYLRGRSVLWSEVGR